MCNNSARKARRNCNVKFCARSARKIENLRKIVVFQVNFSGFVVLFKHIFTFTTHSYTWELKKRDPYLYQRADFATHTSGTSPLRHLYGPVGTIEFGYRFWLAGTCRGTEPVCTYRPMQVWVCPLRTGTVSEHVGTARRVSRGRRGWAPPIKLWAWVLGIWARIPGAYPGGGGDGHRPT